jgi:hypothetical protein
VVTTDKDFKIEETSETAQEAYTHREVASQSQRTHKIGEPDLQ